MRRAKANPETPGIQTYRRMLVEKRASILAGFGVKFDLSHKFEYKAEEDQAQISHDEFVSLRLSSLDYVQLRLIEEALDRISSGDYGVCLSCEQPLPPKRLKALPWARYCVGCQEQIGSGQDQQLTDEGPKISAGHG